MKKLIPVLLVAGMVTLASCDKDNEEKESLLFGQWKTSYGDTVLFAKKSGKNMVYYDATLNPGSALVAEHEYRYRDGKFFLNRDLNQPDFRQINSFKWLDYGKSFQIRGVEWFFFLSSTEVYYTFTRIL